MEKQEDVDEEGENQKKEKAENADTNPSMNRAKDSYSGFDKRVWEVKGYSEW